MGVLLEVAVAHERDVPGAVEGGADRLHVVGGRDGSSLSPEITTVSAVCRDTDVPVFVLLRLNDSWTTTGGELTRLVGLAEDYLTVGAKGVSFGFLDADTEVDTEVCTLLATSLANVPWTFHDAVDDTLDPRLAWRRLVGLPGLVHVRSAGSPRGMGEGYDDLLATAETDPAIAALLMPGGGPDGRARAVVGAHRRPRVPPRRAAPARRHPQGLRRRRADPVVAAAPRRGGAADVS